MFFLSKLIVKPKTIKTLNLEMGQVLQLLCFFLKNNCSSLLTVCNNYEVSKFKNQVDILKCSTELWNTMVYFENLGLGYTRFIKHSMKEFSTFFRASEVEK